MPFYLNLRILHAYICSWKTSKNAILDLIQSVLRLPVVCLPVAETQRVSIQSVLKENHLTNKTDHFALIFSVW